MLFDNLLIEKALGYCEYSAIEIPEIAHLEVIIFNDNAGGVVDVGIGKQNVFTAIFGFNDVEHDIQLFTADHLKKLSPSGACNILDLNA